MLGTSAIAKIIKFPFPKSIRGSKLELKWLGYLENREKLVSTLPKAITFDTVGFLVSLVLWKLDIHNFPGTPGSTQSTSRKTFKYISEVEPGKGQNY